MDKKEFATLIYMLEEFYEGFKVSSSEERMLLWYSMLFDVPNLKQAVKEHIRKIKFKPTVASLIECSQGDNELTETEAWGYLSKALSNSAYKALAEWEKLPQAIKETVSPHLLKEWAMLDCNDVQTVIQSNFMRSYRVKKEQIKHREMLDGSTSEEISRITKGIFKEIGK